jgi:hypothetical protein
MSEFVLVTDNAESINSYLTGYLQNCKYIFRIFENYSTVNTLNISAIIYHLSIHKKEELI